MNEGEKVFLWVVGAVGSGLVFLSSLWEWLGMLSDEESQQQDMNEVDDQQNLLNEGPPVTRLNRSF